MNALVIDTSAAMSILLREPGHVELLDAIEAADGLSMTGPTVVELGIVIEARKGPAASAAADRFVRDASIEVVPFDGALASRALEGWRRWGKGRHPAGLNLGDCFTYALAVERGLAVLCVGEDFAATDVAVVRPD